VAGEAEYLILDELRPALDAWLASRGFVVHQFGEDNGLPVYIVVPSGELLGRASIDEDVALCGRCAGTMYRTNVDGVWHHANREADDHPPTLTHTLSEPEEIPVPGAAEGELVNVRWLVRCSCGDVFRASRPALATALAEEMHLRTLPTP
jgi:hypothetical protein